MKRTRYTAAAICACALGVAGPMTGSMRASAPDDDITLKGCLVKGEGDGAGYLLTNALGAPGWQRSEDHKVEPSAVGTTGGFDSVFYWLDDHDELAKNVGHEVEVSGEIEGDLKEGEIKLDRKDKWTEVTVKSDGRAMKALVPNASIYPAPDTDRDRESRILVRRVDVAHVKMLAATCAPTTIRNW